MFMFFFFQAEDGIRDKLVTGVQTCALPIYSRRWTKSIGSSGYGNGDRNFGARRRPGVNEPKRVGAAGVVGLHSDQVLASAWRHRDTELHRVTPILDILAVNQVKASDRDWRRCVIDHEHELSITAVIHLGSRFDCFI